MGKTILLADDSVTIQKVVELTFMDEDYEVIGVGSGDEAISRLEEGLPDLVIADVHMPGRGGYDVCRRAKELAPELPVLLLVGTFEPFDEGEAESAGADGHLKKPFDSQELLRRVDELMTAEAEAPPGLDHVWSGPEPEEGGAEGQSPEEIAAESAASMSADELEMERSPWEEPSETPTMEPESDLYEEPEAPAFDEVEPASAWQETQRGVLEEEAAMEAVGLPEAETGIGAAPEAEPAERPPATSLESPADGDGRLSDEDVERVARKVVELMGDRLLREVAWEVVPDLAEVVIKERIRELERQLE